MRILLFFFLLFFVTCTHAQHFGYVFNRITTDDGLRLSSNNISSIYQDKDGFIWVGHSNGLQRFDGNKFILYNPGLSMPHKLPQVAIEKILPAGNRSLWLAAYSIREFGIFDPVKFTYNKVPLRTSSAIPVRAEFRLWQDGHQQTFISVSRYGKVLKYDPAKNEFNENTPLNNLPSGWKGMLNVHHDVLKNQYWIVADSGLCVYDVATRQMWSRQYNPAGIPLLNNKQIQQAVSQFYIDKKRRHWVFNWTGGQNFYCFDSTATYLLPDRAGIAGVNTSYAEVNHFFESSSGTLWLYGLANLYVEEKNRRSFSLQRHRYTSTGNISYEKVNNMFEDRTGIIWIATDQGLYYTLGTGNDVANIYLSEIPGKYNVTSILQLATGQYWLATWGEAVLTLTPDFKPYATPLYKNVPATDRVQWIAYRQVWAMHQHSTSGKIFLGCQRGQLMIFDTLNSRTVYLHPPEMNMSTIRSIAEGKQGHVFFGTQGGRLVQYDGSTFSVLQDFGSGAIIFRVLVDHEGSIWLGVQDQGIYLLDESGQRIIKHFDANSVGLFNSTCKDIEQIDNDHFAAATGALTVINKRTGHIAVYDIEKGLPSNSITRLSRDGNGYIWIITDNGLCRFDHQRKEFTTYGKEDGILMANAVKEADYLSKEKLIMFAGVNSLMCFHPSKLQSQKPPPDVAITDFTLDGNYLLLDSLRLLPEITLKPHQDNFTIQFACLDFRNRDKYTYYYQMLGIDNAWIRTDNYSVVFSGLSSGHYIFRVKAVGPDGATSAKVTELKIFIRPPFWRTGWFISVVLTVIALIVHGFYRMRLNKIIAVEKIRNRVARDLHDDMGSTLSTINILSSMAKAKLHTDTNKAGEFINKISDNSQRMMEAISDIVWAIKPSNDSMAKVVARMREFANNIFEARDIELEFKADEAVNDVRIDMEGRRDFFLVFKEAVNNAAKYSKCTLASVEVLVKNNALLLKVIDNGAGFDVTRADSGNGLGNMQKRAASLGGKLHIVSTADSGTTVSLTVPLNRNK